MKDRGELYHDPNAPEGVDELPEGFWDDAVLVMPEKRSVHLKLDAEVFDFFHKGGKGHLTRMQNVLRAYVKAQTKKAG
jgi:uncharacterized protein (DUF4415 family)